MGQSQRHLKGEERRLPGVTPLPPPVSPAMTAKLKKTEKLKDLPEELDNSGSPIKGEKV